jgi:MinD superfamily P-loop ATPase
MKEIVVISGKGGTGKTSLVAALAALARDAVLADCDVDAADLHLVVAPEPRSYAKFVSGREAVIRPDDCIQCGACLAHCRFEAVRMDGDEAGEAQFSIDPAACEGCGVCVRFCPVHAIDFPDRVCGEWYVSDTRVGPMVHARLRPGAENSGKLVSKVREEALGLAQAEGRDLILTDGPPGIGCPVIASVTGATLLVVVTEPTHSGEHDLGRVLRLARHFELPASVCVNKWDLNPELADRVEAAAAGSGAHILPRVRYDRAVTRAQVLGRSVVEHRPADCVADIERVWCSVGCLLEEQKEK